MQLKISNLHKEYSNGVKALNNININIDSGMFGLLGPNGAGKSSLMRTIVTLQNADSGEVFLDDLNILQEKDEVRKIVGYLPQDFGFYPGVNAVDLLHHFALLKGISNKAERKEICDFLLQQTNLWDARKRAVSDYSGGMRQRFGIAQALLGDPKLIVVDEPTAGLDPTERNRFHNLLSEIGENKIVILSTHIVEDVYNLCSKMAVMSKGAITLIDTPSNAIKSLQGKIWKSFINKADLPVLRETHKVLSTRLVEGNLQVKVINDVKPADSFAASEPDLEDVYFANI